MTFIAHRSHGGDWVPAEVVADPATVRELHRHHSDEADSGTFHLQAVDGEMLPFDARRPDSFRVYGDENPRWELDVQNAADRLGRAIGTGASDAEVEARRRAFEGAVRQAHSYRHGKLTRQQIIERTGAEPAHVAEILKDWHNHRGPEEE